MSYFQATTNRIQLLDALRGLALFGILLANIPMHFGDAHAAQHIGTDRLLAVMHILINTKFITLFSLLFGLGFYLQWIKAAEGGVAFRRYFFWRMLLLFGIGCVHAYGLWWGDILRYYALCGLALLLVYRLPQKALLWLAILFNVVLTALVFILNSALGLAEYDYDRSLLQQLFQTPSYRQYIQGNFTVDPMVNFVQDSPLTLVSCFGKMLLGVWLGKVGFLKQAQLFAARAQRWMPAVAAAGLAASVGYWAVTTGRLQLTPGLLWLVFLIAGGLVLHSLFYLWCFVKAFQHSRFQKFLFLFVPVGRMALTNYMLQTVFYLLLFYNWTGGFKLMGKLSAAETYGLALLLFAVQTVCSHAWMQRFRQGPVEWVWKRLAYRTPGVREKGVPALHPGMEV